MAKKYFFSSIRPYVLKDRRINLLPRILCLQKYFDDWKWNLEYKISTWIIVNKSMDLKTILYMCIFYTLISIHKEYEQASKMKKFDRMQIYMFIPLIFFCDF